MTVELIRKPGDEWFRLFKLRHSSINIEEVLPTIEWERYHIYKSTSKFRKAEREEVEQMKYAGYIFFDKSLYSDVEMDEWIKFLYKIDNNYFKFISKPFPPEYVKEKIRIIN